MRFVSSTGRSRGRCAQNTVVASVTPRRASVAETIAVTVMNASVPRPVGPSSRVIGTTAASRPALPATCAHSSGAEPRPTSAGGGAPSAGGLSAAGKGDQLHEDPGRVTVESRAAARPFAANACRCSS